MYEESIGAITFDFCDLGIKVNVKVTQISKGCIP